MDGPAQGTSAIVTPQGGNPLRKILFIVLGIFFLVIVAEIVYYVSNGSLGSFFKLLRPSPAPTQEESRDVAIPTNTPSPSQTRSAEQKLFDYATQFNSLSERKELIKDASVSLKLFGEVVDFGPEDQTKQTQYAYFIQIAKDDKKIKTRFTPADVNAVVVTQNTADGIKQIKLTDIGIGDTVELTQIISLIDTQSEERLYLELIRKAQ
ncbi:hypothetical protein A2V61_00650 [Candidatus Woesebacteria bacterium RBG_19FT_COMBO_47_8]|uniref:Uncharacterized protein n=1 Tax=Candidatus Woesebacteria bacterium RBG_13_46_13 TaxID=1802479 RepID=A0A1F7X4G2_9BACT|nr:MAG: hypothetical protein A2Y68_00520 [Candidatus Woesebacteria bacterium RBG_13_46_13]OGM17701.1 MAG: hypothetical protein A2V61_00650 [Candidatus Woesebacteria bacterium RBG_19FT_COMBO_47_8]HJX59398.1 hypothetical protein [Patescibacteria group bacterium]